MTPQPSVPATNPSDTASGIGNPSLDAGVDPGHVPDAGDGGLDGDSGSQLGGDAAAVL
jgi:hypothetical protein